jgi:hypothetical protein
VRGERDDLNHEETETMSSAVASEIAKQIGGQAFMMMGTTRKFADGDALVFDVRGCPRWNKVKVTLNYMDTYDLEFIKIGPAPAFHLTSRRVSDVYFDQLHEVIERETGLYLSLGTVRRGSRA